MSSNSILSLEEYYPFFNPAFPGIDLLCQSINPGLCNFEPFSLPNPNERIKEINFPEEKKSFDKFDIKSQKEEKNKKM